MSEMKWWQWVLLVMAFAIAITLMLWAMDWRMIGPVG